MASVAVPAASGIAATRPEPPPTPAAVTAAARAAVRDLPEVCGPPYVNDRDDPAHLCNYHLYRVSRAFDVDAGPTAPAFQQPGGGLQYLLMTAYVPQAPTPLNVRWLVDNGYLSTVY